MTARHAPMDSEDAREQREAEAEREAQAARQASAARAAAAAREAEHEARCTGGWLGLDADERPVPCPVCRPHTQAVRCWTCSAPPKACDELNAIRRGPCCPDCDHRPGGARTR